MIEPALLGDVASDLRAPAIVERVSYRAQRLN
jgi:hypothetical protein